MNLCNRLGLVAGLMSVGVIGTCLLGTRGISAAGQDGQQVKSSYAFPVVDKESFSTMHDLAGIQLAVPPQLDTVEYFNLVLGLKLNSQEKKDLVAFMCACKRPFADSSS